jgi:hypothetical protein
MNMLRIVLPRLLALGTAALWACGSEKQEALFPSDAGVGAEELPPDTRVSLSQLFIGNSCAEAPFDLSVSRDRERIMGQCIRHDGSSAAGVPLTKRMFFACTFATETCSEKTPSDQTLNHELRPNGSSLLPPGHHYRKRQSVAIAPREFVTIFSYDDGDFHVKGGLNLSSGPFPGNESEVRFPPVDLNQLQTPVLNERGEPMALIEYLLPVGIVYHGASGEIFVMCRAFEYFENQEEGGENVVLGPGVLFGYRQNGEGLLEMTRPPRVVKHSYAASGLLLSGDTLLVVNDEGFEPQILRDERGNFLRNGAGELEEGRAPLLISIEIADDFAVPEVWPIESWRVFATDQNGEAARVPVDEAIPITERMIFTLSEDQNTLILGSTDPLFEESRAVLVDVDTRQPFTTALDLGPLISSIVINGDRLYATGQEGFSSVFDIHDPNHPQELPQRGIALEAGCADAEREVFDFENIQDCLGQASLTAIVGNQLFVGIAGYLVFHPIDQSGFADPTLPVREQ